MRRQDGSDPAGPLQEADQRFFGADASALLIWVVKLLTGAVDGFSLSFFGFLASRLERT